MFRELTARWLVAGCCFLVAWPVWSEDAQVTREVFLMGTRVRVQVRAASRATGLRASELVLQALRRSERRLSTWGEDTELARLNRAPVGAAVRLSPALFSTLERARDCARRTRGAFDPAIGPLVEAWGLRAGGRLPSDEERRHAERLSRAGAFRLNPDGTAVRMWAGASLEEGGFGKGAALDEALAAVRDEPGVYGVLIDLGGQVGVRSAPEAWRIELAHPGDRGRAIAALRLTGGSLATSGNSEHGIEIGGVHYGHLLDPRSGWPARDFGSLVVLAPDGLEADCLSTGLYVLGPDAALDWALRHPGIDVAVLESDGDTVRIRATPGLAGRLDTLDDGVILEPIDPSQQPPLRGREASNDSAAGGWAGRVH